MGIVFLKIWGLDKGIQHFRLQIRILRRFQHLPANKFSSEGHQLAVVAIPDDYICLSFELLGLLQKKQYVCILDSPGNKRNGNKTSRY